MGIPVALTPQQSADCLRATGFTFLYAPALHPAMKRVQPIRRALGFRTIFNLAGPLTNPAEAPAQIMGVYSPTKLDVAAGAMARLGIRFGRVVHARNGIDEIALSPTDTIVVRSVSDHGPPHAMSAHVVPGGRRPGARRPGRPPGRRHASNQRRHPRSRPHRR
jgi:anthranilate phosphoribosyltransferase